MRVSGNIAAQCVALLTLLVSQQLAAEARELPALDCVINPHKVFDLGSSVRGVLESVSVERSDYVEANQVVAELDARVERASLEVAKARATISSEKLLGQINLAFDTRRKERIDNLYANQSVSIQNKEDAELEAALSEQRLREAAEREEIRALELRRAEELLEQKIVRTPVGGFVLKTFKSAGEYVEDQPIVRIAQLDKLSVEVIAPMELFGLIEPGMKARVFPETHAASPHLAEVTVVDRMGDVASSTFGARLSLANENYQIPAGVKCRLQFLTDRPGGTAQPGARQVAESRADDTTRTERQRREPNLAQVAPQSSNGESQPLLELLIENLSPAASVIGH